MTGIMGIGMVIQILTPTHAFMYITIAGFVEGTILQVWSKYTL